MDNNQKMEWEAQTQTDLLDFLADLIETAIIESSGRPVPIFRRLAGLVGQSKGTNGNPDLAEPIV